ncbi:unnamed protein product [Lupinus luteus]|uniref:TATA box-binding protein-associated factor RNA polymerase I subunit B n=1 Tax=Lupinus luteus TaxID=3873 RepID=A0AAV1XMS3_LUPLU
MIFRTFTHLVCKENMPGLWLGILKAIIIKEGFRFEKRWAGIWAPKYESIEGIAHYNYTTASIQLPAMVDVNNLTCQTCNNVGLGDGSDGFFYCLRCGSQYEDVVDTAVDADDLFNRGGETGGGAVYMASHQRQRSVAIKTEPASQYDSFYNSQSNFIKNLGLEEKTPQRNGQVKIEIVDTPLFDDRGSPSVPEDFGGTQVASFEDYYNEIRGRYVMGLQLMIELQCEALVKDFKVTPLICGLTGPIWLRFVSQTGVFDDDWGNNVFHDSEKQKEEVPDDYEACAARPKYRTEPHTIYGQRAVMIWFRSLKKSIPLAYTLAVSFLACHVAREAILPSDMMKWTLEGKLPYFSAFVEIERRMGYPSNACPICSSVMFRPQRAVSVQKLESCAASIAQSIGLELPPVNFYAIAYRYLKKLALSVKKILPYACRIYEWSMPPDLWLSLSKNYFRLPTHVCVMSILVVAIRILYNINGFGEWEKSLSHNGGASSKPSISSTLKDNGEMGTAFSAHELDDHCKDSYEDSMRSQNHELDSAGLIHHLETRFNEIANTHGETFCLVIKLLLILRCLSLYFIFLLFNNQRTKIQYLLTEYSKDLQAYLQYCSDVAFAGSEPSFEEEKMIEYLCDPFQNDEDTKPSELLEEQPNGRRPRDGEGCISRKTRTEKRRKESYNESASDDHTHLADDMNQSVDTDSSCSSLSEDCEHSHSNKNGLGKSPVNEAIRKLKLDMEENRFCYIPPRVNLKRFDYLHYVRKKDEGALTYVAHADYYILLRACAKVAQVDIRILHIGVLSLERRLGWLENRINQSLCL